MEFKKYNTVAFYWTARRQNIRISRKDIVKTYGVSCQDFLSKLCLLQSFIGQKEKEECEQEQQDDMIAQRKRKKHKKVFFSEEGKRQEEVQKKKRKPEEVMNEDKKTTKGETN